MTVNNVNVPDRSSAGAGWLAAIVVVAAALVAFFYLASPDSGQRGVENNVTIEQPKESQPAPSATGQDAPAPEAAPSGTAEPAAPAN